MTRAAIVIDEVPNDVQHFTVTLWIERDGELAPLQSALIPRPLPLPAGGAAADGDLADRLRSVLAAPVPDVAQLRTLGRHLWDVSFSGAVADAWHAADPSRTILDVRAPDLRVLPWEAMHDGIRPLFTSPERPFVRSRIDAPPPARLPLPVRVLVVVGEPDDLALRWTEEVAAMEVLCARQPDLLHVEVLLAPTLATVDSVCRELRPHVLHVIAHGQVVAGEPSVRVAAAGGAWALSPQTVVDFMPTTLKMAVLNACHTGAANALRGAVDLSAAFRENGAAATICMQGPVNAEAAAMFSAALYEALLQGKELDVACTEGRRVMGTNFEGSVDRWLPTMDLAVAPGPVVTPPAVTRPSVPFGAIDRTEERRRLLFALRPPDAGDGAGSGAGVGAPLKHAVIVRGVQDVGKTSLVQTAGHVFRAEGGTVRYVNLKGTASRGWLDVLRAIRGIPGEQPLFDWFSQQLFARFNQGVNAAANGRALPARLPTGDVVDEGRPIGAVSERTLDHVAALFDVFRAALAAAAGPGGPLLLIVDHVENIAESEFEHLIRDLFLPIARGEVPGVSLVLAARPPALDQLRKHGLVPLSADVEVRPVAAAHYRRLAAVYHDLCRHRDLQQVRPGAGGQEDPVRTQYDKYIELAAVDGPWKMNMLFFALGMAAASGDGG